MKQQHQAINFLKAILRTNPQSFVSPQKAIFRKEKHSSDSMMHWHHVILQNIFPCKISSFWHRQKDCGLVLGFAVLLLPSVAFALSPLSQGLGNPSPGAGATLQDFVYLLIDIIRWVALPALAVCIIYAGFTLVSAGGDEKKIASGKLWLVSSLIGTAIILGARVIADIVFGTASLFE